MSWKIKGTVYETCAAEGHCPLWFGRDTTAPCTSFMVLKIDAGHIDDVPVDGMIVAFLADLKSNKFEELAVLGGEGGIYISDSATDRQRQALEPFFANNIPGMFLVKEVKAVKFVKMDLKREGKAIRFTMPSGEFEMVFTNGAGGNPIRIENTLYSSIMPEINVCDTKHWHFDDLGKKFDFIKRSGVMFPLELQG